MATEQLRGKPAFYALKRGGWRDLVTILHLPYTAWMMSYVAIGAAVAPEFHGDRLWAALAAFFLAVGISAHALDELNGRPLRTTLSDRTLVALGVLGLAGAVGIGIVGLFSVSFSLLPLVAVGAFLVLAYNLELFGGRFHTDLWFALAWGAFPAFTGYWSQGLTIGATGVLIVAACFALTIAQRELSTPVRRLRRHTVSVTGQQSLDDGEVIDLSADDLAAPLDSALKALSAAMVLLAVGLVLLRV